MKLTELVSPEKSPPKKKEKERRMEIAKDMMDILMKASPTSTPHAKIFVLADKAAGKSLEIDVLELKRNQLVRDAKIRTIANSPLNIVKLHSIKKQMEKILRGK